MGRGVHRSTRHSSHSPAVAHAVAALVASAEHYLPTGPFSVMNKSEVAASGNKHDFYYDLAIYWGHQESWSNAEATTDGTTSHGCIWPKC